MAKMSSKSIRFKCHNCGKKLKSHKSHSGKKGTKTKNIIPEHEEDIVAVVAELLQADNTDTTIDWIIK